jgi:hypothetical protein
MILDYISPSRTTNNKQSFSFGQGRRFIVRSTFESNTNVFNHSPTNMTLNCCPKASLTIDLNHPLHPHFSEAKSIRFHIRSGSVHKMMESQTNLANKQRLFVTKRKTGMITSRKLFNE